MLQERSHRKHISRAEGMQRGPTGKSRRLIGVATGNAKIRVGKSAKQLRPNERIQLRKDAV
jgi:hypothetical protein